MTDIKQLLGEDISQETADKLQGILDEAVDSLKKSIAQKEDEIQDLQEQLYDLKEDHANEVEHITEKAEEYAQKLRDEAVEDITEKAEAYGKFLIEKADAYGDFLQEKADEYGDFLQEKAEEYGEHLIEQADAYGDFLQEKAEAYGEHLIERAEAYGEFLIESAEEYGEAVEDKCLAEAKIQIDEFKSQHLEEFERLDEHSRVMNVFNSLKGLVEESGFAFEDASLYDELKEERSKNRRLVRTLRENEEALKRHKILEMISESNEDISLLAKEKIVKSALRTRCEDDQELAEVVKTLVENNLLNNNERNTLNKLDESTTSFGGKVSGWGGKLL